MTISEVLMRNLVSFLVLITISLFMTGSAPAKDFEPARYKFDKDHTTILFFINHLGYSDKIGRFNDYEGYFLFDEKNPESSKTEVTIKTTSIDTGSKVLDAKLQEKDWFNTAEFPDIKFRSTQVNVTGTNKADVVGWLTMLGVEKPVTLHATFNKAAEMPMVKHYVAGFSADGIVKRSDFGMISGVPFVEENVRVHIEMEGIREE